MSNDKITELKEWVALEDHKRDMESARIKDLFEADAQRFAHFNISLDGFVFDYSKQRVTADTLTQLMALARARGVEEARDAMVKGDVINASEERSVLHMALRGSCDSSLEIDGENVTNFVDSALNQIKTVSDKIRANPQITDVINIGIGGSDLGPHMVYHALRPLQNGPALHFIANVDGEPADYLLKTLDPRRTLVIVTSKTFTTLETLTNARTIKSWMAEFLSEDEVAAQMIAVTSNPDNARAFGIKDKQILPLRSWIGGRFSLWSAVGLPIAISYGFDVFKELLDGAHAADKHFIETPLERNIPALMAMIGVWYRNFWNYSAHALLPYTQNLAFLAPYLQQLDMESNGKRVDVNGQLVDTATGPIIFGQSGTNAQHAFMQLFHQGTEIIPADFIICAQAYHDHDEHQTQLISNALAQSKALMEGSDDKSIQSDAPHRYFPGNRPSSTIMMERLDARHLGMLLAFYEHKIFVQGTIWGINSFDQWGVELGKSIAKSIHKSIDNSALDAEMDSSTAGLLNLFRKKFIKL